MSDLRLVLSTVPDADTAAALARAMVRARLAACVNIVPAVRSVYVWDGELADEQEVLLVIKSTRGQLGRLQEWLEAQHPYAVPELVALEPAQVSSAYARWITDHVMD